jgi:hypothetical protein
MAQCNQDCPFFMKGRLEDNGNGLTRINFKCKQTNTIVSTSLKKFEKGYTMHDCPLVKKNDKNEDDIELIGGEENEIISEEFEIL